MSRNIAESIAEYVREAGGRTFYVGGFVRDRLLGIDNKDVDIEVHGIEPDALLEILKNVGEPLTYGKSFGVYNSVHGKGDCIRSRLCTFAAA